MPGIITHHVFGSEVYAELVDTIGPSGAERDAFLLGNQGPDPLLYRRLLPQRAKHRKLGGAMHTRGTAWLLSAFHESFTEANDPSKRVLRAYALGFLCHFFLDSTVHPLVYAQQYAICDAGVDGLAPGRRGVVHAAIETELDEYVLSTHWGLTVGSFVPHSQTLVCAPQDLATISAAYVPVVQSTYHVEIPRNLFSSSVRMYQRLQTMLDAKSNGLRKHVDYARLSGDLYQQVQAMSHADCLRTQTAYANSEHVPWPHPFRMGSVVDSSFDELYAQAFEKALAYVPRYTRVGFTSNDCMKMTNGMNFRGVPIGRMPAA